MAGRRRVIFVFIFLIFLRHWVRRRRKAARAAYESHRRVDRFNSILPYTSSEAACLLVTRFTLAEIDGFTARLNGAPPSPSLRGSILWHHLFIFLMQMTMRTPLRRQALLYAYSKSRLEQILVGVAARIIAADLPEYDLRPLPPRDQARMILSSDDRSAPWHCVYIVDGTYFPIERPKGVRRSRFYSQYRRIHAWLAIVLVDFHGRFRMMKFFPPCGALELGRLEGYMPEVNLNLFKPSARLLGDKAYKNGANCIAPASLAEIDDAPDADTRGALIDHNYNLSRRRVLIEHMFGRLKNDFSIFTQRWPYDRQRLPDVVRACCVLENYLTSMRRRWTPNAIEAACRPPMQAPAINDAVSQEGDYDDEMYDDDDVVF